MVGSTPVKVNNRRMARQCLFCGQRANSAEHLWPDWILKKVQIEEPFAHSIGGSAVKFTANGDFTVKKVCKACNNGWMSHLEQQSIPLIGCLLQDISSVLDPDQQTQLARWVTKTAMILDATSTKTRNIFYTSSERQSLRDSSTIPEPSVVSIGRLSKSSLAAYGTEFKIHVREDEQGPAETHHANAAVIVVGRLVAEIFTVHLPTRMNRIHRVHPAPGSWDRLLVQTWPTSERITTWPPPLSFDLTGQFSIATLMRRWQIGQHAPTAPTSGSDR